ncbi:MAG: 2Fe-2S iron-sulfur cluster binding domain-containing protein, partial [Vicinamibacterales bacterium]
PMLDGAVTNIMFTRAGTSAEIVGDQTVLEAAEDAGVEIPFECRSGICGQCKTPLVSGHVTMEVQDALTAGDRARGLILACQARAVGDVVVEA